MKIIPITLDILNPADIYKPNMETAMKLLKLKFKGGVCYAGAFISNIVRIVKATLPKADKNRNDGRMLMDVLFEAECIVFVRGEIIPDVMVTHFIQSGSTSIPSGRIGEAEQPIAYVYINRSEGQAYKENGKGPVIVYSTEYPVNQAAVINAIAFKPTHRRVFLYECSNGTFNEDDIEYLTSRSERIREMKRELEELGKGRAEQIIYFRKLLYPKPGDPVMPDVKGFNKVDITEVKDWGMHGASFMGIKPTELGYASGEFLISTAVRDVDSREVLKPFVEYIYAPQIQKERALTFYDSILNITELEYSSLIALMKAYPVKELTQYKSYFDNFKRMKSIK